MPELSRRQFIKIAGLSTLGASLLGSCTFSKVELLAQSPHQTPEDLVTGTDNWYATLCSQCPAQCGIVVRVVEGRAVKVEGNPLYPINEGKICPRGQAELQELYHPDRITQPWLQKGQRGSGNFAEITWDEALGEVTQRLAQLRANGRADTVLLATQPLRGRMALVTRRFMEAYGGRYMAYEPLEDVVLRAALNQTLGQDVIPEWDIASANYIISFGADFLSTWLSPVRYAKGYGEFRQGDRGRGTLVQIEPRFSLTAANADRWIANRPGTEGLLALSLAQVIVAEGLVDSNVIQAFTRGAGAKALEEFRPERVQETTGVTAEVIRSVARDFARQRPSLALGGGASAHTNGLFNMKAIFALNYLVGSIGQKGGLFFNPNPSPETQPLQAAPFAQWRDLVGDLLSQKKPLNLLLIHKANLAYGLPSSINLSQALTQVPFIVSFASFLDETSAQANLILPTPAGLEDWGDDIPDPGPGYKVLGLRQPTVYPVGDTKAFADIILALAQGLGPEVKNALPWTSFREALQDGVRNLYQASAESQRRASFTEFWQSLLQQGGSWNLQERIGSQGEPPPLPQPEPASFAGEANDYPYNLIPFLSNALYDGRGGHLPWLQATPDPLTTVAWTTWVEMNAQSAREQGLQEGDVMIIESPYGSLEAALYLHPLMPPGVIGMPVGQGYWAGDRYSKGRGTNPLAILAPLTDGETGALAWAATRIRLRKTGRRSPLPKFEGVVSAIQLEDEPIIQTIKANPSTP
ncbi:MAG: molybdopterin-dependent oxidoreductase [Chloroflexi bacterium]|nr:molybdopterin-dependent oxidoreductase [Chloroflexota bacterium]